MEHFMPHGMCYLWNPWMLLLQVVSDGAIALAYFSIPMMLLYFVRKRRDIPFSGAIAMFGLFIIACGLTHVMGIWTIWHPAYWIDGGLKAVTAVLSLMAAVMLVPRLPKALALRNPARLEQLNARLEQNIRGRDDEREESERQFQSLAEALPEIVWTAGVDGGRDYYNRRWFDYTGMTLEESTGWRWQSLLHPDDVVSCVERWRESVRHGTLFEAEYRLKRASDGAYRWHLGRAQAICDASGSITKWFGTCTDIDDQKCAYHAERRTAEQLRFIVDASNTLGASRDAREAVATLCELIVPRFADWVSVVVVEDDGRMKNVGAAQSGTDDESGLAALRGSYYLSPTAENGAMQAIRTAEPCVIGEVSADDMRRWTNPQQLLDMQKLKSRSAIFAPLVVRGKVIGVLSAFWSREGYTYGQADVPFFAELANRAATSFDDALADLRRTQAALSDSETRYRALTEAIPQMVWVVNPEGRFQYVNDRLSEYAGLAHQQSLVVGCDGILDTDDLTMINAKRAVVPATEFECEARLRRYDGIYRWHLIRTVPLPPVHGSEGGPPNWIVTATDIEERKSAEAVVSKLHETALAATDAKSRFLATMSHEIRTPMNGIIGMTELLSVSKLTEEQSEYVKVVRDSGRSLLRVLNDILDYSKIEAGKLQLETMDFDLLSQVRSVVSLLGPQFKTKSVSLTTHVDSEVPVTLNGDPGRLRQILINLVGNALKFTPAAGSVRILVAIERRVGEAVTVRFRIVDSGIGIAPDARDRLFQPFSQVDGSTTRKYGGTGLGLSICKQLVDLMGGQIGIESGSDPGTCFWFTLPFRGAIGIERVLESPARDVEDRRATVRPRTEKLLLAEDNEVNTLLAIKQFNRLGFGVTVVSDGKEAVKAVQTTHFDVVFMDCHMPEMDGLDATRAIRALPSDMLKRVPIVAMTADAQAEDKQACLAAGMDDYISKPATLSDLRTMLGRWLPNTNQDVVDIPERI